MRPGPPLRIELGIGSGLDSGLDLGLDSGMDSGIGSLMAIGPGEATSRWQAEGGERGPVRVQRKTTSPARLSSFSLRSVVCAGSAINPAAAKLMGVELSDSVLTDVGYFIE
jgi:hypothetical protein